MKSFLSFFLAWCVLSGIAQPRITAEVSSSNLAGDELLQLQYTVEGANKVTQFLQPRFTDLALIQGPNQTQGYTLVNGELKAYTNFIFVLRPLRKGRIMIPPATAKADGQTLTSKSVVIDAGGSANDRSAAGQPGASTVDMDGYLLHEGEQARSKIKDNLFVRLELSRTTCFVGEPVVAVYKLYTRLNSESKVAKRPSFNGFSVYDMVPPESDAVMEEKVRGRTYHVYLLRKVQLYPLQAGSFELESMEIDNQVSFVKSGALAGQSLADVLQSYGEGRARAGDVVKERVTVSNAPVTVVVRALPGTDQPSEFSGAVGRFSLATAVHEKELHQGDVAYLDLSVTGEGNLPVIGKPQVSWPKEFETFEDSLREDYNLFNAPIRGIKTFTIPFSPHGAGQFDIPAIRLVYFDPDSGRYRTALTGPLHMNILPPRAKGTAGPELADHGSRQTDRIWLLLPVALILGMVVLFFWQRAVTRKKGREPIHGSADAIPDEKEVERDPEPPTPLIDLGEASRFAEAGDAPSFYRASESALLTWLQVRYDLPPSARKEGIRQALMKAGMETGTVENLIRYLQDCEIARFSPLAATDRLEHDLARLRELGASLMVEG
jgi:hypothetical protein